MKKGDLFLAQEKRPSAVDLVVDSLKRVLITKKLRPGEAFPPEQVLADKLKVSRGSVREAMKILAAFGIVEIKRGNGTYISDTSNRRLFDPLLFQILVQDSDYQDLIEIRSLLEIGIVRLLVQKASNEEIFILKGIIEEFERARLDSGLEASKINKLDLKYHLHMGEFSHNPLIASIYSFICELFFPTINSMAEGVFEVHRQIQDALERRDTNAAVSAIERHTLVWSEQAFKKT